MYLIECFWYVYIYTYHMIVYQDVYILCTYVGIETNGCEYSECLNMRGKMSSALKTRI